MKKLSVDKIIEKIRAEEVFDVMAEDDSFRLKIDEYIPYVCAAIHNGHLMRLELLAVSYTHLTLPTTPYV